MYIRNTRNARNLITKRTNVRYYQCLPFKITIHSAKEILTKSQTFFDSDYDSIVISPIYVPFYGANINDANCSFNGKYGKDRDELYFVTVYDGKQFSVQPRIRTVTDWSGCHGNSTLLNYPITTESTQIYAGFEYSPKIIENVLRTKYVSELRDENIKLTENQLIMQYDYAKNKIKKHVKKLIKNNALIEIKNNYNADRSEINTIAYLIEKFNMLLYYVSAYICVYSSRSKTYYRIVNGYTGEISKSLIYGINHVAIASSCVSGISSLVAFIFFPQAIASIALCNLLFVTGCVSIAQINNMIKGKTYKLGAQKRFDKNKKYLPVGSDIPDIKNIGINLLINKTVKQNNLPDNDVKLLTQSNQLETVSINEKKKDKVYDKVKRIRKEYPLKELDVLGLKRMSIINQITLLNARDTQLLKLDPKYCKKSSTMIEIYSVRINDAYNRLLDVYKWNNNMD